MFVFHVSYFPILYDGVFYSGSNNSIYHDAWYIFQRLRTKIFHHIQWLVPTLLIKEGTIVGLHFLVQLTNLPGIKPSREFYSKISIPAFPSSHGAAWRGTMYWLIRNSPDFPEGNGFFITPSGVSENLLHETSYAHSICKTGYIDTRKYRTAGPKR